MRTVQSPTRAKTPTLSVLVPFFGDDPGALLRALDSQVDERTEILLWDDGTQSGELTGALSELIGSLQGDVRLFVATANRGRAGARNALFERARGEWVLFLDADMMPGDERFLERYLQAISAGDAAILFGGFTVEDTGPKETALHRALSQASDCADATERAADGPKHVASSNLCVRRDVLETDGFDTKFEGWGWEDSEWAARVSRTYRLAHLDNPAVHLGLETHQILLRRFATSGQNYLRFVSAHPELAQTLPLYRHARQLAAVPGQALMRPVLKAMVSTTLCPMRLRILALKLWRASHYAEDMRGLALPATSVREVRP